MSGFITIPEQIIGSGSAPIGTAGGELSGNYPNPNVIFINGASVPDSGSIPIGNVLQISSSDTLSYSPINLAGGVNYISGILPITNQAAQVLGGDLSGTTILSNVIKLNGTSVPASPTNGHILIASDNTHASWLLLSDNNIDSAANISGTKLASATTSTVGVIKLSGDLSGSSNSPSVISINGTAVAPNPTTHQVLIASSINSSTWSLLSDNNISNTAAISSSKLLYNDNSLPNLGSTTIQGAIDSIKTSTVSTAIQKLSQTFNLASLQSFGSILTSTFNVGSALPNNARVLGAEINVTQALAGLGVSAAIATIQSSGDTAGSLVTGASLLGINIIGNNGINQYLSRGGSQITSTITLTGAFFSGLTAGSITVNVFYAIII